MEIRQVKRDEMQQAIALADTTFGREENTSMGDAFPQIFASEEIHSFGAFDEGEIVSFIGLVPSVINVGAAKLQVFSIGSVCTDEAYRGRGISTTILKEVYKYIDAAGASLLFISGDRGMYMRNHCYYFGKTKQYTLKQGDLSVVNYSGVIRVGDSRDAHVVNELRKESEVHVEASEQEWSRQLESGGYASVHNLKQDLFIAEKNGELDGYVVIGLAEKGSIVTEWGGCSEVVQSILSKILDDKLTTQIKITIPWYDKYNEVFAEYVTDELHHGGSIYLVDPERVLHQAKHYLSQIDSILAEKIKIEKSKTEEYKVICGNYSMLVTEEELIRLLFTPDSGMKFEKVNELFPIPLPSTEGMYYV